MRLADAKRDHYRKLAKDQGYRSRSAYKLMQLDQSYHLLRKGANVVDLGCAPGGWLQVAKSQVGGSGIVIGIDLKPVEPVPGAEIIQGSIEDAQVQRDASRILAGKADLVLSDLAPNVSGVWDIDHERQIALTRSALAFGASILRQGGNAVFKVFEGESLAGLRADMKGYFAKLILSKPTASRQESSELYLVCMGFLGRTDLPAEN